MENKNFRSFLLFQTFNSIGVGMFGIFMMWAVHALYQNPLYTGIAGFMFVAPGVASFIVGPFVDRRNKVVLLRLACFIQLCVVTLLLAVPFAYWPGVWLMHLAILVSSIAGMISGPAQTALLPRIVDGEDLIKANALIRILATVAGLGIGVLLYMMMARGAEFQLVYAVNTVVLAIALVFSIFMRSGESQKPETDLKTYFAELKTGLAFVKQNVMLYLVAALVFLNLFAEIAVVNLPMFAEIHAGSASGYILLIALSLVGGLIGSYISRIIGSKFALSKIFVLGFIAAGAVRIVFVNVIATDFTRSLWVYILYVGLGSTIGIFFQTFLQKYPPKHLIARVNTITTSLCGVAAAIGTLAGGIAGTLLPDVDMIFIIQGVSYIAIGLCLCLSGRVRELPKMGDVKPHE